MNQPALYLLPVAVSAAILLLASLQALIATIRFRRLDKSKLKLLKAFTPEEELLKANHKTWLEVYLAVILAWIILLAAFFLARPDCFHLLFSLV